MDLVNECDDCPDPVVFGHMCRETAATSASIFFPSSAAGYFVPRDIIVTHDDGSYTVYEGG